MGTLNLSEDPLELQVSLTRGSDFVRLITPQNADGTTGSFAANTELKLVFSGPTPTTWPATVTTTQALWSIDQADVAALMDTKPTGCKLTYKNGSIDRVWAIAPTVILYG